MSDKSILREHLPMLRGLERFPQGWSRPSTLSRAATRLGEAALERRGLIRGGLSLASISLLTGCDVGDGTAIGRALRAMSSLNDRA